ncbi:ABC transporter ATP-binding protein [Sorangium sp. So ce1078]|uniref:ABC transporter ATP-binding protein n=1 Tax=Sorangium sp. So ce1078 TaxID=3133329 RepID=UPI003F5DC5CD
MSTIPGPAVRLRDVRRAFGARPVLGGVDLTLRAGEFVALLGASGSGKSTLLRVLAGLDVRASGDVVVPERRAVVFQEPRLFPWKRVWRNVALGLPCPPDEAKRRALLALAEVGLSDHANAWPLTLSGGEAQRAALARSLVREPEVLLLDEPFGALDALTRIRMHGLLAELCARHRPAVLLVTHDVDEALLLADRALVLARPSPEAGSVITADLAIDLPAPRRRSSRRFPALRSALLAHLGVEGDEPDDAPVIGSAPHAAHHAQRAGSPALAAAEGRALPAAVS